MSILAKTAKFLDKLLPSNIQELEVAYDKKPASKLDIYGTKDKAPKPVIMFWHGGSWKNGDKAYYKFMANSIEKLDAIPVIVGYTRYPDQTFPGFIEDAHKAVKWAKENIYKYGGDPESIYVMGHSSGAHAVVIATLRDTQNRIAGCIAFATPINILEKYWLAIFGKKNFEKGLENPLSYIGKSRHRFLLVHGMRDKLVKHEDSEKLHERLQESKNSSELLLVKLVGHILILATMVTPFKYMFSVDKKVKDFISKS